MIISRVRSLFVLASVGLLLSVLTGLWFANHSVSALDLAPNTDNCTFYIDSAKTKVLIDCGDSTKWTLAKKSSNFYSWKSPKGCTLEVTLNPRTAKGDYTVSSISPTACNVFPKPKKNVSIKAAPGGVIDDEQTKAKQAACEKEDKDYADPPGFCVDKCQDSETRDADGKCVSDGGSSTSCVIDGVGWLVCSVVSWFGRIIDGMYWLIEKLLDFAPLESHDGEGHEMGLYTAWGAVRSLANVAFVIVFMIVVYSQITGGGLTNYAIKKMVPKLVIAALAVNISWWISAVAVDVSNILGASVYDQLQTIRMGLGISGIEWQSVITLLLSGSAIGLGGAGIVKGASLIGTVAPEMLTSLVAIIALGAVLAIIITVFILIARQVIIAGLVILSPLAFVALVLPNTEKWFTKWRQTFISMLMLYPIVSFVFGLCALLGFIMMTGPLQKDATPTTTENSQQ